MRQSEVDKRRTIWRRTLVCVGAIALLTAAGAGPAAAAEFEMGEVKGRVDTTVSVGASMRVHDRDCDLIHVTNGGCTEDPTFLNSDDGDLNYDKWDVFANTYKATVDLDLRWRNFGGFFRGTVFYDLVTMETNTERTDLDRDARYRSSPINSGVVGMGYQLLDAYVYGNFDVAGRPLEVRVGNQVLSWGESLFYQAGVASINTVDLNRLRAPGSDLKEAFLPAPMVRVSAELFPNFGIEAFYQLYWNYTQLDPVGSYFSTNDLVGRAAEGLFTIYDPGLESRRRPAIAERLATPPEPVELDIDPLTTDPSSVDPPVVMVEYLEGATAANLPRTAEELFAAGYTPTAPFYIPLRPPLNPGIDPALNALIASGLTPRVDTKLPPFLPFGMPRLKDRTPSSQGQWGVALRYFVEAIRTEFGAYYLRIHDKIPYPGYVADPFTLALQPTYEDLSIFEPLFNALYPLPLTLNAAAIPVGYFREYPENINVFGLSASTEFWGIAWGAEVSYKTRQPVHTSGNVAVERAIAEATETGRRATVSGYTREKRLQAQINAIATLGPGDPYLGAIVRGLHVSSIAVTLEVAAAEFPSLDKDIVYQTTNNGGKVDEFSWGYTTRVQGFYDNPFDIPITVVPRISFAHDVHGDTPGFYPFIEHRKSLGVGVNVDYLGVWQFDLSYTNNYGAGPANGMKDRDWVSASVTYSF